MSKTTNKPSAPARVTYLADGTVYGRCRTKSCGAKLGAFEHDYCSRCYDRLNAAVEAFEAKRAAASVQS